MKTLTTSADTARADMAREPVWIMQLDPAGEARKFSDRTVDVDGTTYLGYVQQWADLDGSLEGVNDLQLTLKADHFARFADECWDYEPVGKTVRFGLWYGGTETADIIWMYQGVIDAVLEHSPAGSTVRISQISKRWTKPLPAYRLKTDDLPDAHPDDVNKPLPIVYGAVERLPCLRGQVGGSTKLNGSILSTDTAMDVDDTTDFPSSGTLLIDDEQITYTGKTDTMFTGLTRGTGGTDAADHLHRRAVIELQADYIFLVADHACKLIDNVRVGGQPSTVGVTIDKNNTTLISGRTISIIKFDERPRSRQYEENTKFLEMFPDAEGSGNDCDDYANVYDDPDTASYALLNESNTPLVIKQTTDMSDGDDEYGPIKTVLLCVEFYAEDPFDSDSATIEVVGETDAFTLFNRQHGEDPADEEAVLDRVHGHITEITGEHVHTITDPMHSHGTGGGSPTDVSFDSLDHNSGSWTNPGNMYDADYDTYAYKIPTYNQGPFKVKISRSSVVSGSGTIVAEVRVRYQYPSTTGNPLRATAYENGSIVGSWLVYREDTAIHEGTFNLSGITTHAQLDDISVEFEYDEPFGADRVVRVYECWMRIYPSGDVDDSLTGINAEGTPGESIPPKTSVVNCFDISDVVAQDWSWFENKEIKVIYSGTSDNITVKVLHAWFDVEFAPFREEVSDEVTCDVEGIEDAGDGTGALLTNPADIIEDFIINRLGLTASEVDATTFAAAQSSLASAGAAFAFALIERRDALEILDDMAFQARSRLLIEDGKFYLRYRPASYGAAVREITPKYSRIEPGRLAAWGRDRVANLITAEYDRDYEAGGYRDSVESEDATSQSDYGEKPLELALSCVRDATWAQALADFYKAQLKDARQLYVWQSHQRDCDLERTDIVDVCDLDLCLVHAQCEMHAVRAIPGSARDRQPDMYHMQALLESGYELYWNGRSGTFVRFYDGCFYFVVEREIVARLCSDGVLRIKGFVVGDQSLPAATSSPLSYDSDRHSLAFAVSGLTRVMEIDETGNVLLPLDYESDQVLSFAGTQNAIEAGASWVWANVGSTRVAAISSAGLLRLAGYVIENCDWDELYE